ncbi:MAG: bifunctional metallophosphatase/5'-nucleotidase [Sulfuricaulis sp.]
MKQNFRFHLRSAFQASVVTLALAATPSLARADTDGLLTIIKMGDLHGHLEPHGVIYENNGLGNTVTPNSGGVAKLYTLISQIRAQTPGKNLLLNCGDTFHGGAEVLFTRGRAVDDIVNYFQIDAFTPGNWDFGYGQVTFRRRFTGIDSNGNPFPAGSVNGVAFPAGKVANYPVVAINLYNGPGSASSIVGQPVLPPYVIKQVNGMKIAVIGITTDITAVQADVFNTTFRETMGWVELPGIIDTVRNVEGADLVVVQSELGLAKNLQMSKEIPGIDVMLSTHTHERTPQAIIVPGTGTILVEGGTDSNLGRLDLKISGGHVQSYAWTLLNVDNTVPEDPTVKAMVDAVRAPFLCGPAFIPHTFQPAGFAPGNGLKLQTQPGDCLDTVVAQTNVTIARNNVLEVFANNFFADAMLNIAPNVADLAITNGYRFDGPVAPGPITVADLYRFFPISPVLAVGDLTGGAIKARVEENLSSVFDPHPYRQRGGWALAFSGMTLTADLTGAEPAAAGRDRTSNMMIRNHTTGLMETLNQGKVYTLISCFANGDPLDRLCQTEGVQNLRYVKADGTLIPATSLVPAGTQLMFPVPAIIKYLQANGGVVPTTSMGRIVAKGGVIPQSLFVGDPLIQATQGAGPAWLGRNDPALLPQDRGELMSLLHAKLQDPVGKIDDPATTDAGVDDVEMSYDE